MGVIIIPIIDILDAVKIRTHYYGAKYADGEAYSNVSYNAEDAALVRGYIMDGANVLVAAIGRDAQLSISGGAINIAITSTPDKVQASSIEPDTREFLTCYALARWYGGMGVAAADAHYNMAAADKSRIIRKTNIKSAPAHTITTRT